MTRVNNVEKEENHHHNQNMFSRINKNISIFSAESFTQHAWHELDLFIPLGKHYFQLLLMGTTAYVSTFTALWDNSADDESVIYFHWRHFA